MNAPLTLAVDAMGGDIGPKAVLKGACIAREKFPEVQFRFFGDQAAILPHLEKYAILHKSAEVVHTDVRIDGSDKPSQAVRKGRKSSIGLAIEAVKAGEAHVAVSAGNTGALMALSKVMLKTMRGIERPALATFIPTYRGDAVMLDLGANVECDDKNLVQFAVMGAAYTRTVLGLSCPKVALLNIGSEELKGNDAVKKAAEKLRETKLPMEFVGFIEGDGIGKGLADVIVTDGFTGNIALKTTEGTARLIGQLVSDAFKASWMSKIGYLFAQRNMVQLREHLDPNNHNGAVFLGLNGLVVKSHGSANASGFANALSVAIGMARNDLTRLIADDLSGMKSGRVSSIVEQVAKA